MDDASTGTRWSRFAAMRPRLRGHVQLHRHVYRSRVWFVVQDEASGRFNRFTPEANFIIGLMDGERSLDEILQAARAQWGDEAPDENELITLVSQLQAADLLLTDTQADAGELARRATTRRRRQRLAYWRSPLALRLPLIDPERGLQRLLPFVRPLFGKAGAFVWMAVVGVAVVEAAQHWPQLTNNVTERVLSLENLLLLALIFPLVKAFHEFGHAFAVKAWGGEVHEMGIMFLVLMPIPYVDASAASAFRERYKRAAVGAAGMMVELFLAALAMFVWLGTEPGVVRTVAYNVMIIASVSTVLFNANPLVRFDGYYILMDLIEIPNLARRSNDYLGYLVKRYLFGVEATSSPVSAQGERAWFVTYAVMSFVYRIFIIAVIVGFVASKYFVIGTILAIWALSSLLLFPLFKRVRFLLSDPSLSGRRARAIGVTSLLIAGLLAFLLGVPLPHRTVSDGIVWIPDESRIRAQTAGLITRVAAAPGGRVEQGDLLLVTEDPVLSARVRVLRAQAREIEVRLEAASTIDRVLAANIRQELALVREQLADAQAREEGLMIRSPRDGVLIMPRPAVDLPGSFVQRGQPVAYVVGHSDPLVRVVVAQRDVDLVRSQTRAVSVRLSDHKDRDFSGRLMREVPAATDELPSLALSVHGGGGIALDPKSREEPRAYRSLFLFDVVLEDAGALRRFGSRAYVRFEHSDQPLGPRLYRALRQLLLKQFNV